MLLDNWRDVRNILAPVITRANDSEHRLELVNGSVVDMWSLDNYDAARGRKYKRVFINEAAMAKNLKDAWTMVVRPTLADFRGGADFGTTPKGLNYFFDLWQAADKDDWARFHYTTYDNPYIPPDEIDAMRSSLPERVWQQEIMAEFLEDGSYFQNVEKSAILEAPDDPANHTGHYLVMGVDWALSNDYTVLTVACRDCNRVVGWERFNNLDFTYQRERLYSLYDRWKCIGVLPERNSIGEPNIEIIQGRTTLLLGPDGKPGYMTTATSKPPLIQGLATALEHDGFLVPMDYADELRAYEVEITTGNPKFSAPDGQHDDRVISLALVRYAMVSSVVQVFV
jgi:hypothetical protein